MIITTQILNNIETALTTPQVEGFYNVYMNNDKTGITCSYNTLLTQLQAGNLPVLNYEYEYEEEENAGESYTVNGFSRIILSNLYSEPENENQINYAVNFTGMNIPFIATDPTANMVQPQQVQEDA